MNTTVNHNSPARAATACSSAATAPTAKQTGKPLLQVEGVSMRFGGLMALTDVHIKLLQGNITALIGPNGAGKTTLFNCITCIYQPTQGDIFFSAPDPNFTGNSIKYAWANSIPAGGMERKNMRNVRPHEATALGMARTFQNIRLFPAMTVLENVMIGRHCRTNAGTAGAFFRPASVKAEEEATVERSYQLLKYLGLENLYSEEAKNLAYGQQRRLEIARALATDPFLLLLDEPAAGMNPHETRELKELILKIRDEFKLTILLIEHDMNMVMSLSDHIYVMEYGCVIASGTPEAVSKDPRVIKAYLGEDLNA